MVSTFFDDGKLFDDWRPLLRILHLGGHGDPYAQRAASLCLAYILLVGCPSQASAGHFIDYSSVKEPLQALLSWISSQLQSSSGASVSLVTPSLLSLVNCKEARYMFSDSGGIGYIARHLKKKQTPRSPSARNKEMGASVQQLYELCFTLMTMTYECNNSYTIRASFARDGAVKSLCDLVKSAPREKVVRVALSGLKNLATCKTNESDPAEKKLIDGNTFLDDMIGCGLMKTISVMKEKSWTDEDLLEGM